MWFLGWVGAAHPPLSHPFQLPLGLYKKVLVIMHDSILPHLAQPSLMIDFLTRAYDVGERGAPGTALEERLQGPGRSGACVSEPDSPPRRD